MFGRIEVSDYIEQRFYILDVNASWITIKDKKQNHKIIVRREPSQDNWYDEKHRAIVDAMRALETAVFAIVDSDNGVKAHD